MRSSITFKFIPESFASKKFQANEFYSLEISPTFLVFLFFFFLRVSKYFLGRLFFERTTSVIYFLLLSVIVFLLSVLFDCFRFSRSISFLFLYLAFCVLFCNLIFSTWFKISISEWHRFQEKDKNFIYRMSQNNTDNARTSRWN